MANVQFKTCKLQEVAPKGLPDPLTSDYVPEGTIAIVPGGAMGSWLQDYPDYLSRTKQSILYFNNGDSTLVKFSDRQVKPKKYLSWGGKVSTHNSFARYNSSTGTRCDIIMCLNFSYHYDCDEELTTSDFSKLMGAINAYGIFIPATGTLSWSNSAGTSTGYTIIGITRNEYEITSGGSTKPHTVIHCCSPDVHDKTIVSFFFLNGGSVPAAQMTTDEYYASTALTGEVTTGFVSDI